MTPKAQVVTVQEIPANQIRPGANDRTKFDPAAIGTLAESIAADGLAQPITVRPVPGRRPGTRYEIVAGERRYRAMANHLGWDLIPCIVRDLEDDRASRVMLTENLNRVDLDPVEEATAYRARIDAGMTLDEIALAAGKAKGMITWQVKILDCIPEALDLVRKGHLSTERAWHLARLDPNRQRLAMKAMAGRHLSLHAFRQVIDRMEAEAATQSMFDSDDFLQVEEFVLDAAASDRNRPSRSQLVKLLAALLENPDNGEAREAAAIAVAKERR